MKEAMQGNKTQRCAYFIALRELGKINPNLPLIPNIKNTLLHNNNHQQFSDHIEDVQRLTREEIEDMNFKINLRKKYEDLAVIDQGGFEKEISKANNFKKKEEIKKDFGKYFKNPAKNKGIRMPEFEPLYKVYMQTIQEIANFENALRDGVMREVLQKFGISSIETIPTDEVKEEVEKRMNKIIKSIGINYLLGQYFLGNYFVEKATKLVEKYLPGESVKQPIRKASQIQTEIA